MSGNAGGLDDVTWLDATGQAELVRRGEVTALELADHAMRRIERLNPALNAFIHTSFGSAFEAARRVPVGAPFAGVPTAIKDLFQQCAGEPYHFGTRFLRDLGWTADHDTWMVAKLREAGFLLVGRTNTPELGPWTTTEPESYGPTRNPWNLDRSPGGSSGGSAAAVAAGLVPVAHANDGAGSVRIPSSACGLVGLKPTRGRISLGPDIAEAWAGMTHESAITRSVRDIAGILDAVGGMAPGDPYTAPTPLRPFVEEVGADPGRLCIGLWAEHPVLTLDVECIAAARSAATLLESLGHTVEIGHPPELDEGSGGMMVMMPAFQALDLQLWGKRIGRPIGPDDIDQDNWAFAQLGLDVLATSFLEALYDLHAWCRRVAAWWTAGGGQFDLLLTPTLPKLPARIGELVPVPGEPLAGFMRSGEYVTYTAPFNATGQPAISLPLHWTDAGLPVGVQLVAAYGREDVLLRVASQLEEARPWAGRRPPMAT